MVKNHFSTHILAPSLYFIILVALHRINTSSLAPLRCWMTSGLEDWGSSMCCLFQVTLKEGGSAFLFQLKERNDSVCCSSHRGLSGGGCVLRKAEYGIVGILTPHLSMNTHPDLNLKRIVWTLQSVSQSSKMQSSTKHPECSGGLSPLELCFQYFCWS
jgi:hypothetical protein